MAEQQHRNSLLPLMQKKKSTPNTPRIARLQNMYYVPLSRPQSNSAAFRTLTSANPLISAREEYTPIRLIEKLVQNLPSELRENILEIANLMSSAVKRSKEAFEKQTTQLLELQVEHDKKNAELHTALHACEVHRRYSTAMHNNIQTETPNSKDRHPINDNVQFTRLTGPNHVLINSLHMTPPIDDKKPESREDRKRSTYRLHTDIDHHDSSSLSSQVSSPAHGSGSVYSYANSHTNSTANSVASSRRQSASGARKYSTFNLSDDITDLTKITIDPSMKDEKLRNSLLTMSREKYRMTKKVEILGDEVELLKTKLEISELKCRHLQIDLAEVKGTDDAAPFALSLSGGNPPLVKPKDFGPVDELFKVRHRHYMPTIYPPYTHHMPSQIHFIIVVSFIFILAEK